MPVIYTEDKVAKAVGDHALGEMGVQTGGVANSIGYSNYQARQRAAAAPVSAGSSGGSGGYQPFWFTAVWRISSRSGWHGCSASPAQSPWSATSSWRGSFHR